MGQTEFVTDREIYERVILEEIPKAREFLWIGTADLKDLHVAKRKQMVPFLEILSDLARQGIAIRLLHGTFDHLSW